MPVNTPVYAIPGMNCSPALWNGCNLPEHSVHIVPSLPSMDQMMLQMNEEIKTPSILVGLSLGGIIAMQFARRFPEKVAGLLLMATNSKGPTQQQVEGWESSVKEIDAGLTPTEYQERIAEKLVSWEAEGTQNLRRLAVRLAEPISAEVLKNQLRAQISRTDELINLPKLRIPVEILCGSNDAICPVERHEEIHRAVTDSNLTVVPGAGHLISLTHPNFVHEALQRLVNRVQHNPLREENMTLERISYEPYNNPDEFIREVTDRIWVERDIEHIYENYRPDSIVHGPVGTAVGVEEVVQGTTMRIAEVPDHIGLAEDVVWEQRGNDAFLSSHLVLGIDHVPTTDGLKIVRSRTIANCLYQRGQMVEEWVVRDSLAVCKQLGIDPADSAASIPWVGYSGSLKDEPPQDPVALGDSGSRPEANNDDVQMVIDMINHVWSKRNLKKMSEYFDRDVILHTVGDRTVVRSKAYQEDLLNLVKAFPGGTFEIRDVQANESTRYGGLRIAVCWKLKGDYTGIPVFGPLTGKQVEVLGVSQFQIHDHKIVREYRVFDWCGVIAQIEAGRDGEYSFANLY